MNDYRLFRRCVKFLEDQRKGTHHQKALDIRDPPSLPKSVMLYRARGVEELEEDSDSDEEVLAIAAPESEEENEEIEEIHVKQFSVNAGNPADHGDI